MSERVQSIDRAFGLLRALSTRPGGISDLARRTNLAVSTTARLLHTLELLGAVERVEGPTVRYRVGYAIGDLAASVDPQAGLVARARPFLVELAARVGETAGISVPHGNREVLYLHHVDGDHAVQLRDWTGTALPLHVVSSGLVLLAQRTSAEIDSYVDGGLCALTDRTTTDPDALRARLTEIQVLGYAWTIDEFAEGISSVAAPVRNALGEIVAALHIHGPSYRFPTGDRVSELQDRVRATAMQLG